MTRMPEHRPPGVEAAQRTLRVIETLRELDSAGVTEIAKAVGVAKSTAHDYLKTLEREEYVLRDGSNYRLGLKLLDHGVSVRNRLTLYQEAKPIIDELAEETNEFANLVVPEYGWGVYIYYAQGSQTLRLNTYLGKREHLHSTAWGKAILAEWPEDRIKNILGTRGLPSHTSDTITEFEELFEDLERTRERGYATEIEENNRGTRCVGTAIVVEGEVIGGISVSGASSRMDDERMQEISQTLLEAGNVIEVNLYNA